MKDENKNKNKEKEKTNSLPPVFNVVDSEGFKRVKVTTTGVYIKRGY